MCAFPGFHSVRVVHQRSLGRCNSGTYRPEGRSIGTVQENITVVHVIDTGMDITRMPLSEGKVNSVHVVSRCSASSSWPRRSTPIGRVPRSRRWLWRRSRRRRSCGASRPCLRDVIAPFRQQSKPSRYAPLLVPLSVIHQGTGPVKSSAATTTASPGSAADEFACRASPLGRQSAT